MHKNTNKSVFNPVKCQPYATCLTESGFGPRDRGRTARGAVERLRQLNGTGDVADSGAHGQDEGSGTWIGGTAWRLLVIDLKSFAIDLGFCFVALNSIENCLLESCKFAKDRF
jgi:hypothetical protein